MSTMQELHAKISNAYSILRLNAADTDIDDASASADDGLYPWYTVVRVWVCVYRSEHLAKTEVFE